ncbi:hypothetical protein HN371_03355 [Candidatus Poribacteria bacterium]|jgi:hypothetical protein|nr:hypothetical protein [Candidatus Poribacteria bacterium]MBT5537206.1 hypothetical protein [Candidatus Poribacteria bacterium]MBT7806235.1 hypothetical protein [Candidatus Poribacteria bacterium]
MGSGKILSSAAVFVLPALLAGMLGGFVFGNAPEVDADEEAASVQANSEDPSTHLGFLESRRAAMKTPKFWMAFVVAFLVVEVAGTLWMAARTPDDKDARLKSMANVVKKRQGPGGTEG